MAVDLDVLDNANECILLAQDIDKHIIQKITHIFDAMMDSTCAIGHLTQKVNGHKAARVLGHRMDSNALVDAPRQYRKHKSP